LRESGGLGPLTAFLDALAAMAAGSVAAAALTPPTAVPFAALAFLVFVAI